MSKELLIISKDRGFITSPGSLCQGLVTMKVKNISQCSDRTSCASVLLIVSCQEVPLYTTVKKLDLSFLYFQVFIHIGKIPPEPSLLQAKQPQLSKPFLIDEMLHLSAPSLDCLHVSLVLRSSEKETAL